MDSETPTKNRNGFRMTETKKKEKQSKKLKE
jgi:hypothetical protein